MPATCTASFTRALALSIAGTKRCAGCVSLVNLANHDVQFLYSQVDCLGKIYYVVKYVTKPEDDLHSKLTIAAAVRKDLEMQLKGHPEKSVGRTMLTKV